MNTSAVATSGRVGSARQRFYRGFARAHHALMVRTGGRPGWLTPRLRVLVLTATGHRSGRPRPVTLGYLREGDGFVVLATNFGQSQHPSWYHNLRAHPDATVTLSGETFPVRARFLEGAEREHFIAAATAANAQWRTYLAATERAIPVVLLERTGP